MLNSVHMKMVHMSLKLDVIVVLNNKINCLDLETVVIPEMYLLKATLNAISCCGRAGDKSSLYLSTNLYAPSYIAFFSSVASMCGWTTLNNWQLFSKLKIANSAEI